MARSARLDFDSDRGWQRPCVAWRDDPQRQRPARRHRRRPERAQARIRSCRTTRFSPSTSGACGPTSSRGASTTTSPAIASPC